MPNNNNCSASSNSGMNYSDIMASMLTPSLPDSRDLKDKLHAAVDTTIKGTNKITRECNKPRSNCAITVRNPISENNNICPGSNVLDLGDSIPYVANMSEYIKKDKIPCYGCNLK